jgi:oligopeptide/dipeptide ABC transporter ATP-binding protein
LYVSSNPHSTLTLSTATLLEVEHLTLDYVSVDGSVRVLDDVSIHVDAHEIVGIVGESGSGKTTLGLAVLGLVDKPPAKIRGGQIRFNGVDLTGDKSGIDKLRGGEMSIVLQESVEALNPVYKVGFQILEALEAESKRTGRKFNRDEAKREVVRLLEELCVSQPATVLEKYPHELSGGMRKRVAIAMTIIQRPKLLVMDEPTTGLDAYVQGRLLGLLKQLNREYGVALLIITHDLPLAATICDRIYVMYAGRILEEGGARAVLEAPLHPYTRALVSSIPQGFVDSPPLDVPPGDPPDLRALPPGCKFSPRCPHRMPICVESEPLLLGVSNRLVRCWLYSHGENT